MRVTLGRVAAVALAIAACAGCSQGSSKANAANEAQAQAVTAVGCPMTPTPGCVTIAANGKAYDVSDAGIDLARGVGVSLKGQDGGQVTACGPKLTDVQVEYLGLQCGAPAAPAS
jgi:uncharacterized lipoprotein